MTNFKFWNTNEEDNEVWDTLFPCRTDDVDDYLNSEGSDEDMSEIGSSVKIEVTAQGNETGGMGTLKTSEALMEDIPLLVAPMEMPPPEVLPATEVATVEQVTTTEHVSLETPQDEVAESKVNITTSAFAGNNCSILNSAHIFYICC